MVDFTVDSFIDRPTVTPRRIAPQNIVSRLIARETHYAKTYHVHARTMYQNVYPNFTVVNVEKPPCFLRKFSTDGTTFVAFSLDQTSIEIYEYQGPGAAENLFQKVNTSGQECMHRHPNIANKNDYIHANLFNVFFKLRHTTKVSSNNEQLNRECSLFTDNGRHVLVGSACYVSDDPAPAIADIYRNNESVSPNPRSPLEDYSLHSVDLVSGKLCDTRTFKTDKIFLSHNQGFYLYGDTLAVLSVQHQTIYIFQVTSDGQFVEVRTIGRFCFEDDSYVLSMLGSSRRDNQNDHASDSFKEATINSLKHRLLVHLYQRAAVETERTGNPYALRKFYQHFDSFRLLRMWKMQLLDDTHLLIKYASDEAVTFRLVDPNSQPSFFVVYNMSTTQVLAVYENTSEDLLTLFEDFCDLFRNASLHLNDQFHCSPSSNTYARVIQHRFKQTIVNAKYGGNLEAVKRMLAQLPISSQSYSSSPYLDLALFSYDDKWVSLMERPKACGDHPIRFYARDSGLLKFKIHAGVAGGQQNTPAPIARRLVAFTFHPHDPFAISVQRTNAEYVVNFHIRHTQVDDS